MAVCSWYFRNCFSCFALLAFRARDIQECTRLWIVQELSRRFESHVNLKSIEVQVWPTIGVTGQGLSIQYRNRPDIEPLIRIVKLFFVICSSAWKTQPFC